MKYDTPVEQGRDSHSVGLPFWTGLAAGAITSFLIMEHCWPPEPARLLVIAILSGVIGLGLGVVCQASTDFAKGVVNGRFTTVDYLFLVVCPIIFICAGLVLHAYNAPFWVSRRVMFILAIPLCRLFQRMGAKMWERWQ